MLSFHLAMMELESFKSYINIVDNTSLSTKDICQTNSPDTEESADSLSEWEALDYSEEEEQDCEESVELSINKKHPTVGSKNECDGLHPSASKTLKSKAQETEKRKNSKQALCGYLSKYKTQARGFKQFKRRWFVFADNTCKLLYFRTPDDMIPLGEIDIAHSSFSFQVNDTDSSEAQVFEVRCTGKTYCLQAEDRHTMMYWLQELQRRRRRYSKLRTKLMKQKRLTGYDTVEQPRSGLLSDPGCLVNSGDHGNTPKLLDSVEIPAHTVGSSTAEISSTKTGLKDISFSNLGTELKNIVMTIRSRRRSDMEEQKDRQKPCKSEPPSLGTKTQCDPDDSKLSRQNTLTKLKNRLKRPKSLEPHSQSRSTEDMSCSKCLELQQCVAANAEETRLLEQELEATREIMKVLQKQTDIIHKGKDTQYLMEQQNLSAEEVLLLKDKQIVDLEYLITSIRDSYVRAEAEISSLTAEVRGLKGQISTYEDILRSKDQIVVAVTNKVFEMEKCLRQLQTEDNQGQVHCMDQAPAVPTVPSPDYEKLKDMCHGYSIQNKFLNKEIVELNQIRMDDKMREKQWLMRYTEMEAKYYQIKSKYFLCLRELQQPTAPKRGGEEGKTDDVVSELLKDAIETEASHDPSLEDNSIRYDQYGFSFWQEDEEDLKVKADTLEKKSCELSSRAQDVEREISHNVKWENYLVGLGQRTMQRTPELKAMIRDGIPLQHKARVWKACVNFRIAERREKFGSDYYEKLLGDPKSTTSLNLASKQIELDLLRTLPNNRHYERLDSEGIRKLRNVLLAYTMHNPRVGYCQGLNRLAAIALLFLNEEDAFWCMVAILDVLMPKDYYSSTLLPAQADQRVLRDLVAERFPKLLKHLEEHRVDLTLFTFNWFLTIFVDNIPVPTYLRIWDAFLYEGNKVLFRFAVAFLKQAHDDLLHSYGSIAIQDYLRVMGETMTDTNRIAQIAFHEINPFPMKVITSKRQHHMAILKSELAELEERRLTLRDTAQARNRDSTSE